MQGISFPEADRQATAVKVTWGDTAHSGRALTGYGLLFWRKGATPPAYSRALVKGASARSHTYTGLQPNTTYQFRIHACNGPDSCGWWTHPPKEVTTKAAPPTVTAPGRVRNLRFSKDHASFTVRWEAPSNTGGAAITGYGILQWRDGTRRPGYDTATTVSGRSKRYDGLRANTKYWVTVHACNGRDRCGAWTSPTAVTTDPVPSTSTPAPTAQPTPTGPLHSVTIAQEPPDSASLKATWMVTRTTGLTRFQVQRRRITATDDWPPVIQAARVAVVDGQTRYQYTYDGLQYLITYRVRVRACTGPNDATDCAGWVESNDVRMRGVIVPRPPGAVRDVRFADRTATSFKVTWNAPADPGTGITGYGLQHKLGDDPWPRASRVVVVGATPRAWTFRGLSTGTHWVRIQACTGKNSCYPWAQTTGYDVIIPPDPGQVQVTSLTADASSFTVSWSAPDTGGVAITGYHVLWRQDDAAWVENDARRLGDTTFSYTATGLNASTTYVVKVRACRGSNGDAPCWDWSNDRQVTTLPVERGPPTTTGPGPPVSIDPECPTISGTAVVHTNVQVDVVPQPRRLASLCWSPSLYATSYFVQATDDLSNLHDPNKSGWTRIYATREQVHVADKAQRLQLDLDQVMPKAGKAIGLADAAAYGIRIGMRIVANGVSNITYTKAIIIIDTPIVEANGAGGTAKIQWVTAGTVLQPTGFGTGSYELRHRQSTGDLKSLGWTPKELALPAATPFTATTNPDTLNLTPEKIHAVQFIYRDDPNRADSPDADVFAARNVYVWPSTTTPTDGYRLATYHLDQRLSDQTLIYRICLETFGPTTDPRTGKWEALIRHAFERWSTSTHGLVKVSRVLSPCAEAEGAYPPGIGPTQTFNYKRMADDIIAISGSSLTDSQITTQISDYVNGLRGNGVVSKIRKQNAKQREIIMLNDIGLTTALRIKALFDFADDLGYWKNCWFKSDGSYDKSAAMCTVAVPGASTVNHDIIVRRSAYVSDMLEVPEADARFNKCLNDSDREPRDDGSAYNHMLHEIGHVIGFGGGSSSLEAYYRSHPAKFIVSVMDYETEPDCAPHFLDIMAVFALYQNRFTPS